MHRDRKLKAVIATMLVNAAILIILAVWYLITTPGFQSGFLSLLTVALSGSLGFTIGTYISKTPSDERETQIFNQSSTYSWLFLFIAIPTTTMFLVEISPPPYEVYAATLLYGIWFVAIIIFSATALYRTYK